MKTNKPLRSVGYYRTSGEGQRDNTSIPTQKDECRRFSIAQHWKFRRDYIDECKSGSKIAGRDAFQQMMKDAAKGEFDIIIVSDITRFGRDGADIIESCRSLARDFGVHVVDTKGNFDTRDPRRTLTNFIQAGVAEDDRLRILTRTINGRIHNAEKGEPWYGKKAAPVGREYSKTDGKHVINDKGRAILDICQRYLKGESLSALCREYGIPNKAKFSYWVWHSQLSGPYYATFNQPEIGIVDQKVEVPGMPEVVPAKLLERVKARLRHNRTHSRSDAKQYLLTGFLRCGCCQKSLTGKREPTGKTRYRHNGPTQGCDFESVLGKKIEEPILDYLFLLFLDEAAFNEAVERAMPSEDTRTALVNRRAMAVKRLQRKDREAQRVVTAIKAGGKLRELFKAQDDLDNDRRRIRKLLRKLDAELAALPSEDELHSRAEAVREMLYDEYQNRNWRDMPQPEVKRFLSELFGDGDDATAGIFLRHDKHGRLVVEMKGRLGVHSGLRNCRKLNKRYLLERPQKKAGSASTTNTLAVDGLPVAFHAVLSLAAAPIH